MEKRYQVFVSSTFTDLTDERRAVMQALLELNCIPPGMELFPASTDDQWTLIQRVVDDCDYYLVIVGGRYGSMGAQGISYTEKEYDYAVQQGTPVMGFVHRQPDDTLLPLTREILEVAKRLVYPGPFPRKAEADALHVAAATVYGCEFLLTWNFKHINNAQMKRDASRIIEEYGYQPATICTPEELMGSDPEAEG
jgi:hypothetical protein